MLALSSENDIQSISKILTYASSIKLQRTLNNFELCLLIDICIKKGNNKHKIYAKTIYNNI